MATKKEQARLLKNAEVTPTVIKARGDPIATKNVVTVNSTPFGVWKKRIILASMGVLMLASAVGMALNWEQGMEHVAYPLSGVFLLGFITTLLTKME